MRTRTSEVLLPTAAHRNRVRRARTVLGIAIAMLGAAGCGAGRLPAPAASQFARAEGIVRVVNGTTEPYRMTLVAHQSAFQLGTVPALEARDFAVTRAMLLGNSQFSLVAITRAQTGRRESERFGLDRENRVQWVLDARLSSAIMMVR